MTAVMMGDLNAVTICNRAHVSRLERAGVIRPGERLSSTCPFSTRKALVDVYIDDMAIVAKVQLHDVMATTGWDFDRAALADAAYAADNMAQSAAKATHGACIKAEQWGWEILGRRGLVGSPLVRRCGLSLLVLKAVAEGCSGRAFCSLLGSLVSSMQSGRTC